MWVSVHQSLDGEKLEKLRTKLSCSKFEAVGILVLFWLWGKGRAEQDGEIDSSCLSEVEGVFQKNITGCEKKPKEIVSALIDTGWIDVTRGVPKIHDWDEWQCVSDSDGEQFTLGGGIVEDKKWKRKEYSEDFDSFWKVYPRRVEKVNAYKNFNARLKEGYTAKQLVQAAQNYADICKKRRTGEEYIKHPATFLGANKPFEDYLEVVVGDEMEDVLPFLRKSNGVKNCNV